MNNLKGISKIVEESDNPNENEKEKENEKKSETNENNENENINPKIRLSRKTRILIFFCFFVIYLFNCSDGGVVSAQSNKIKEELNIGDKSFGLFGSIVQIGRIIGTFSVMFFLDYFNRKILIFSAILLKCNCYLIFIFSSNYLIVMIFRFLQGFSHVFPYIYFPTWIDQFGLQKYKTIMTSFIVLAPPFGAVLGFNLSTILNNYKYAFSILASALIPLDFILLFIPQKFFSKRIFFYKTVKEEINGRETVYSLFEIHKEIMKNKNKKYNKYNISLPIFAQLLNPIFFTVVFARSVLLFSFQGLHYWIGDYFENALGENGKLKKSTIYSTISLLGPSLGSLIGGAICEYFGGYSKKTSSVLCLIFSILNGLVAFFIPFVRSLIIFSILLFLFFFFGNCMMPIIIGIAFNSVENEFRGACFGINSLVSTFLGNLPSPSVYGFINSKYKEKYKSLAMGVNLNYTWVNVILLAINCYFRLKQKDEEKIKKEINKINLELQDFQKTENGDEETIGEIN